MSVDSSQTDGTTGFIFGDQWPKKVSVVTRTPPDRDGRRSTQTVSPKAYTLRLWAAVLGFFAAVVTGSLFQQSMGWIQTTDTASGAIIAMSQPPATWWYSMVTGVVALLFIVAAMEVGR